MLASDWHRDARLLAVVLHTLAVGVVAVFVALQLPQSELPVIAWLGFVVLDFPLSLLAFPIRPVLLTALSPARGVDSYRYVDFVAVPAVLFAFLGGLQWFGIVSVLRWASRRKDRSRCRKCGYPLRGLPEPRCPECGTPFDAALLKELHENGE